MILRALKLTLIGVVSGLAMLIGVTWVALESSGVVLVETAPTGIERPRLTHVWFVERDGRLYLEAGHPRNGWVRDLASIETLTLVGASLDGQYRFAIDDGPEAHTEIRAWMRAKYGWRDAWIGLLFDMTCSWRVALEPAPRA